MKKVALFVFNGDPMCFTHVMLYAKDFHAKGDEVRIVLEGTATMLPGKLSAPGAPFGEMYRFVRENNLIDCVCKGCSVKMGVNEEVEREGLVLNGELSGHPSLDRYIEEGYQIITF